MVIACISKKMTTKTKAETIFALVGGWKSSKITQKQFCAKHDLKASTFAYRVAKHKRASSNSEPNNVVGRVDKEV
jgi:hypothetical protein